MHGLLLVAWAQPELLASASRSGISLGYTGKLCLLQLSDADQNVFLFDITVAPQMLLPGSVGR